jgi:hypothetical protein
MRTLAIVTRRHCLRMFLGLGAVLLVRRTDAFGTMTSSNTDHLLSAKLANVFYDRKSATVIGLEYLRRTPMEADVRRLTNLICSRWQGPYDDIAHADTGKVKTMLLSQQREDFEKGRIVNVQGWILSETEARLCALAALV